MRTYIIRAFLPWLIFLAFADGSVLGLKIATLGGALTLLLFNWRALKEKFLFDWASILFLIMMWAASVEFGQSFLVTYSLLIAYLFLAIISFMSLWLRVPVALQHAKSRVAVQYWNHPLFIGVNHWITVSWGIVFLMAGISVGLFDLGIGSKFLMISIIPVVLLVGGIIFTALFPDHYKKKVIKVGTVAALNDLSGPKMIPIGTMRLIYRTIGKGPLLILLQDSQMNLHHWDPDFIKMLSQQFELFLFDYPGVGYSTYQQMPYTAEQLARCVKEMIDSLSLKPLALLGYGMGGVIAQSFAIQFPKAIKALILIAINESFDEIGNKREDYDKMLELYFSKAAILRVKAKLYKIYDGAALEGSITEEIVKKQKQLLEDWNAAKNDMKKIPLPILLITGANDSRLAIESHDQVKLMKYDDAGHGVIYQYPKDVAQEISKFLGEC